MITSKEDLYGTVIEIKSSEDADFIAEFCAKFGIELGYWSGCKFNDGSVCAKISHNNGPHGGYLVFSNSIKGRAGDMPEFKSLKRLTLSDLKPRTKVEYEKCKHKSAWEVIKEHEESGNLFVCEHADDEVFNSDYPVCGYDMACIKDAILSETIYRKVERPVEWWEDAAEFIVENDDDDLSAYFDKQSGNLRINTNLPRDKWCDFARILLEQEGE